MKRLVLCMGLLIATTAFLAAQQAPPSGGQGGQQGGPPSGMGPGSGQQASPAATASVTIAGKNITIAYSSPKVKGRTGKIFTKDGLIGREPNYPVWRAGANQATKLHTDADLDIAGLKVPKGDYSLYMDISDPSGWMLIVNKQTGQWGLSYDKAQDLGRVKMTMKAPPALVEELKYVLTDKGGSKGALALEWENMTATVPIAVR
jgi:hypothetical protein